LGLCLNFFDEKEAKRNGEYYQNVAANRDEKRAYETIKGDIEARSADVKEFEEHFIKCLNYLVSATNKYNACNENFNKINEHNSRLNDLYFLADDTLKQNLKNLTLNYDSTLYFLDNLKIELEKYSLKNYKIDYSLAPISVYRLHGLISADLLNKNVLLWDYKSWVNAYEKVLDSEVDFLYKNAEKVQKENFMHINNLLKNKKSCENYKINPLIINKIYKYDYKSAVAPLLSYQENKIAFLCKNIDFAPQSNRYFYDFLRLKLVADSLLNVTNENTNAETIKKYSDFFEKNYGGFDGFKHYLSSEKTQNDSVWQNSLNRCKTQILNFAKNANDTLFSVKLADGTVKIVAQNSDYQLILFDSKGKLKRSVNLQKNSVPQKIIYDDIAQTFLVAQKGTENKPFETGNSNLQLTMYDITLAPLWKADIAFDGYLTNIVKINNLFYIYGTCTKISNPQNEILSQDKATIFAANITAEGNYFSLKTFDLPQPQYLISANKINSEFVDLIAIPDFTAESNAKYFLLTTDNKFAWK
jgi:hypothetical protein